MRPEFFPVYGDLYDSYRQGHAEDPALQWIIEAIDQAVAELGIGHRLRPDARLFLLINCHQLTVLPLLRVGRFPAEQLRRFLSQDVRTLLREAMADAGEGEISGHAVLTAVGHLWHQLTCLDGAWNEGPY